MNLFEEYDVREFNLRCEFVEKFVKYISGRQSYYKWMIFFHDGNRRCDGVDDVYYHVLVWFKKLSPDGKTQYFSNIPLMQWVRRTYRTNGHITYPNVLCFGDIELRIDRLMSNGDIYLQNMSFPHPLIYNMLSNVNYMNEYGQ